MKRGLNPSQVVSDNGKKDLVRHGNHYLFPGFERSHRLFNLPQFNLIFVSLFGEKFLPVGRKLLLGRISAYKRIECGTPLFRSQNTAKPLSFFLPAAECSAYLDCHVGVGKIDGEICNLGYHNDPFIPLAERGVNSLPFPVGSFTGNERGIDRLGYFLQLIQILTDHQNVVFLVIGNELPGYFHLYMIFRGNPVFAPAVRHRVFHLQGLRQGDPYFVAVSFGNPALLFKLAPGYIVTFGTHQGKNIILPSVLTDQGSRQSRPAECLNFGGDPEYRGWQEMHLVVDDKSPVVLAENIEMGEIGFPVGSPGENLVGSHGYRPDQLPVSGILPDLLLCEACFVYEFIYPLVYRRHVGGKDERTGLHEAHNLHADNGFAGSAGQDNGSEAAARLSVAVESLCRLFLVVSYVERVAGDRCLPEAYGERISLAERSLIPDRIADLYQCLLYRSAINKPYQKGLARGDQILLKGLLPRKLRTDGRVIHRKKEGAGLLGSTEGQFPEAFNGIDYEKNNVVRYRKTGPSLQARPDLVGVYTRRSGIPEAQGGNFVGVNMLRRLFKFGKGRYCLPAALETGVVHIYKQTAVTLDDQRSIGFTCYHPYKGIDINRPVQGVAPAGLSLSGDPGSMGTRSRAGRSTAAMRENSRMVPVSCNKDCGGGCALMAEVKEGRLLRIIDNPLRPGFMRGCMKGYRMTDVISHPDRLLYPLIRNGERGSGSFRRAGWEEALSLIAGKIREFHSSRGVHSVMRLGGSGSCRGALHNTERVTKRFLALSGGYTDTAGNYSSEAGDFVKPYMYGTRHVGIDVRRLEDAGAVVLWGFNPFDTRFGSETEAFLLELAKKGMPFYVVDPRRTATVRKLGARWFPVKPGSDAALFTALIHHFLSTADCPGPDRSELDRYAVGFDALADHIIEKNDGIRKDAAWASAISSLPAAGIEELAAVFAERQPVALLPGLSIQRTVGGEEADRLAGVLQLVSGNAMLPGGTIGSGQWNTLPKPRCGRIPVPGCGDVADVPVYSWPDAVLEGGQGGFPSSPRFLYCVGGNPLGQGSDLAKSVRAFDKADFSVVHDCFMTTSALHADVVLPVTTFLEREDICFTNGNYLFYSAPATAPPGETRSDYRIFSDLAELLGFGEQFTGGLSEEEWIRSFLEESEVEDLEKFMESGIYTGRERKRRGLERFFEEPEAHPLDTPSGKIEISSESYARAGGPLYPVAPVHVPPPEFPLLLITPHEKYRIHSQFDNIGAFKKLCDDRLWIHTDDAAVRGICDGERVIVSTLRGELLLFAKVGGDIAPGTVSAHQGAWPAVDAASGIHCSNVNVLTSTEPTMPSRGSRTHTNFAEVRRWHGKE